MAHRASLGASKTVAIKLLAPNLASKPEYRKMFLEEARLSMLLNNSGIVQIFDAGEFEGECYMAMEWIDGVNLAELQSRLWAEGQRIPIEVAMYVLGEVLRALDYAHNLVHEGAASIVHRDVSPQNVMLSMAGEVKLMDFGVARFSTEETTGLHVKGKLRYMPPEQLQGNSRDPTVDVFAVGAVLHEMLEGEKFRGTNLDDGQLLAMIFAGEIPRLSDPSAVSLELETLRRGLLMPDARQRVSSARAALQMLSRCPNYRNAALELETLVRVHRTAATGDASLAQGHRTGSFVHSPSWMGESQMKDTSVSRPLREGSDPPTVSARFRASNSQVSLQRRRGMAAALLVALSGLCVGSLGVGVAIRGVLAAPDSGEAEPSFAGMDWARFEQSSVVAQPVERSSAAVDSPSVLEPAAEPELEPEEAKPEPEEAKPEPAVELQPPKPKVKPPLKPAEKALPPVKVVIAAGDFTFLYLKIGSKIYMLDPALKTELSPGKHSVRIREDEKAKWKSVSVDIPKKACRVVFKKPKGVQITIL